MLTLLTAHFKDEAPVIGSGFRFVYVKLGRKWVYLLDPYTARTCRVSVEKWAKIRTHEVPPDPALRVAAALANSVARAERQPTRLEARALGGEHGRL